MLLVMIVPTDQKGYDLQTCDCTSCAYGEAMMIEIN